MSQQHSTTHVLLYNAQAHLPFLDNVHIVLRAHIWLGQFLSPFSHRRENFISNGTGKNDKQDTARATSLAIPRLLHNAYSHIPLLGQRACCSTRACLNKQFVSVIAVSILSRTALARTTREGHRKSDHTRHAQAPPQRTGIRTIHGTTCASRHAIHNLERHWPEQHVHRDWDDVHCTNKQATPQ